MIARKCCIKFYADSESSIEKVDTSQTDKKTSSTSSDSDHELFGDETVSDSENHTSNSSEEDTLAGEQPVCEGTAMRRRTFEATFLALSNKHKFSKSTRTDIFKFLETFIPKPNLPSSNYMFEKQLIEAMDIHYSKYELCVDCSSTISEGKCLNSICARYDHRLNDHEIEVCYFIPIKDQLQRILRGKHHHACTNQVKSK